jgi:beta-N-acetylhexosaminidase
MRSRVLRGFLIAATLVVAALAILSITGTGRRPARSTVIDAVGANVRPGGGSISRPRGVGAPAATAAHHASTAGVSLAKMVGQQVMVRMVGTTPDNGLLVRIRNGQVGGVILYGDNIVSPGQTRSLVARLQHAARSGGNPPLLISTDQEGGGVKRLPWAPPDISPPAMGAAGSAVSRTQGRRTGAALRAAGINVDLAPVVDVPHSASVFIWQQNRAFGMSAAAVINSAVPFADGMRAAGVAPTAKHFPGLGGARTDTDYSLQSITSERKDLAPYRPLIADQVPLIMASVGIYPNLDPSGPAAMSRVIITGLLRHTLGYKGVVITDDLEAPTGSTTARAVVRADAAGDDIILVSTTEAAGATAYRSMLSAARSGTIPRAVISSAYQRILALKHRYAAR